MPKTYSMRWVLAMGAYYGAAIFCAGMRWWVPMGAGWVLGTYSATRT